MRTTFSRASIALLLACSALITVPGAHATPILGDIVFTQPQVTADGSISSDSLSLTNSSGTSVRGLTAVAGSVIDDSPSWSPDGMSIVFEHGTRRARNAAVHYDLYRMDAATRHVRRLTSSRGSFMAPVWGPSNRIAYVSDYVGKRCLSVLEADGSRHDLFCPPTPAQLMRPVWSADGKYLYLHAGYETGSLEPLWRSLAYRIDSSSGAPVVLDDQVLEESANLEFSPDGRHGIFYNAYPYTAPMTRIDFATGAMTPIGDGYAPRWSPDGRRIAFTGEVYALASGGVRYFEPLYVMAPDGTNVRRLTISNVANHAYTAVQWSRDNVHLLVNRRDYLDPSLTMPDYGMRVVNADTRSLRTLPQGFASPGAWYER